MQTVYIFTNQDIIKTIEDLQQFSFHSFDKIRVIEGG